MRKFSMANRILALVAAVAFLASCSAPAAKSTEKAATPTSAPMLSTASASAGAKPAPTDTPPPPPTAPPQPTSWPMATPGPENTPVPANAPRKADDYYIVNIDDSVGDGLWNDPIYTQYYTQGDEPDDKSYYPAGEEQFNSDKSHLGVVDSQGKVVLPFQFNSITTLDYGHGSSSSHVYFYAVGYTFAENEFDISDTGYIYNTSGKKAFSQAYSWVSDIEGKLIAGYREDAAGSGAGVMTYDGKTVVPFTYENIVYLGDKVIAAVGGEDADRRVDFFNFNGTLKGTIPIGEGDTFELSGVLVAEGTNGEYGFIDSSMNWCCEPQWSNVDDEGFCDGYFDVFTEDGGDLYVNKYGKEFTPDGYEEDINLVLYNDDGSYATSKGHILFANYGESDHILFDDTGKILLTAEGDINYLDGVILADGKAFSINGKDLLPGVTDVDAWIPEDRLFICDECAYAADGTRLPLPAASELDYLQHDRFLITLEDGGRGVCNSQGQWLVQPSAAYPDFYTHSDDDNRTLIWPVYTENGKYGLADGNGKLITGPVFDDIQPEGNVFEVWCGPVHGLIDGLGNWIWYSSFYDLLLD